jgi:hypothetical protein
METMNCSKMEKVQEVAIILATHLAAHHPVTAAMTEI